MQEHYTRLSVHHYNKKGKAVYSFKCHVCGNTYINSNNAAAHCALCLKRKIHAQNQRGYPILEAFHLVPEDVPEEVVTPMKISPKTIDQKLSMEHAALMDLIADMNIPYTQLNSKSWEGFIHTLNPGFKIPSSDKLRSLIIDYAQQQLDAGLYNFKGLTCGLAIDGATLIELHTYAFILVNSNGLRLAGFKTVDNQRGATLAAATAEIITTCREHGIFISGVVSDNAPNLVLALSNMDPNDPLSLCSLIGSAILRIACSAHTGQLAVNDVMKTSVTLENYFNNVTSLLKWIEKRCDDFKKICSLKIPKYVATRWNTLASCGTFIEENREEIHAFIEERVDVEKHEYERAVIDYKNGKKKNEPEPPTPPPVFKVPEKWRNYTEALNVIVEFTDRIEGDLVLLQELFLAHIEVESKLEKMASNQNIIASHLLAAFRQRFCTTGDLTLAELAYVFTPEGHASFRALPEDQSKRNKKKKLKEKLLETTNILNIDAIGPGGKYLAALFENYLCFWNVNEGDDPYGFWIDRLDESIRIRQVNANHPIPLNVFATTALILISLPASESMVERAFSQIKTIASDYNKSMKNDLFISLATIKLCFRYRNKYMVIEKD